MVKWSVAMGLAVAFAVAGADDSVVGAWMVKQEFRGQERVSTLTIGENAGTWASERGTSELSDVKTDGGTVTFTRTMSRQGQEFSMDCTVKVVDGVLVGTMTTPRGEREFTATRVAETPAFVGQWDIEMDFQGRQVQAKLDIMEADGAMKGKWSSQRGDADLDNVAVKDDTLTFSRTMERQGQEFTIDYSAKIVDGNLDGNMVTPMGEMPFTGAPVQAEAGGGEAQQMLNALDANGDGTVSEDEAPDQMKQFFSMIDADASGGIDATEMQTVVDFLAQQGGN